MPTSLQRHIGQLVVAGFAGVSLPVELRAIAREFDLGGAILFARNVEAPLQVAEVAYDVKQLSDVPPWVSVDQEGGRVQRLRAPFTEWPALASLGRHGEPELTERFARALARELHCVGITLDYAPVLDVHTNAANPVIGDRALAEDPAEVARLGAVFIRAFQAEGVAACGKHFPGHGDTSLDSHLELPVVEHDPDRLRQVELQPFRAAIEAGVAAIMTAHVAYPALDEAAPATLSRAVVTGLLRDEMGYDGLAVTDDLAMGAIAKHYAPVSAAVEAVAAGCDLVLLCEPDPAMQVAVIEGLIHAIEDGSLPVPRVEEALARQRRARERFLRGDDQWRPPTPERLNDVVGCAEHQDIGGRMREAL
jgi:beta-N-acetylhexosaminidase